ncbi:MAG: ABC transporter substrate-binding protein [Maribacter sp.]
MKRILFFSYLLLFLACGEQKKEELPLDTRKETSNISYAKGFTVETEASGITIINVTHPWPNSETIFTYALIPKEKQAFITLNKDAYDAIISVPIEKLVVTSTTHIPALEALGVLDKLVGFPDTKYISSKTARSRIAGGFIKELGQNESLNTEAVLALQPELVVGFTISSDNATYKTFQRSNIPVVYNGDWVEETPLGKAEWIKFFASFFGKEIMADSIFNQIEGSYLKAKELAQKAPNSPTVMSGALYKDVWYLPGGKSWAASFIKDANADYIWQETPETGSLSLSWESVLNEAKNAEYWIGPGQYNSYTDMKESSPHYTQFDAFQNQNIFTFTNTLGETGGVLYYELAPQRPDLVLQDLIHIFHKDILPDHEPYFFKPLQ